MNNEFPNTILQGDPPSAHQSLHREKVLGLVYAILSMVLFGVTAPINKLTTNFGVDPLFLAFIRAAIGTLFLFPFYLCSNEKKGWTYKEWRLAFIVGAGISAGAMALEISGTKMTSASNASLIISLESLVATLLSVLILKENLSVKMAVGAASAFLGLGLVFINDILHLEFHIGTALTGDFLVLAAVFVWSLYTVFGKPLSQNVNPVYAIFFVWLFTSLSLGVLSMVQGNWKCAYDLDSNAWLGILYLGIAGTGIPHLLYYQALKRLMASTVSMMLTTLPVFGIAFSCILLGETISFHQIAGAILIMTGIGYTVWVYSR